MAVEIKITVPTLAKKTEMENAFAKNFPIPLDKDDKPTHTKAQWMKVCLLEHGKDQVRQIRFKAVATTEKQIRDKVDTDFPGA